jgi:hypothetical protein
MLAVSGHGAVRVVTADQLSIETSNGQRLSALALDRIGSRLTLALPDGTPVSLSMPSDCSLDDEQEGLDFSRQLWVVNRTDTPSAKTSI